MQTASQCRGDYGAGVLDFGFPELMVIIVLAVLVVGPEEIPKVMYGLGRILRRLQYVRYAFTRQFDEFMEEHDLDDIRKSVNFEEKSFDEAEADEDIVSENVQQLIEKSEEEKAND